VIAEKALFTSLPVAFSKIFLSEYNPSTKIMTGSIGWISPIYMGIHWEFLILIKVPIKLITRKAKHWNIALQDVSLGLIRSLLNSTFDGEDTNNLARVSFLWRTMLYRVGYCFRSVVFSNHLFSQNLISDPSLIEKDTYTKKCLFVHQYCQLQIMKNHLCDMHYYVELGIVLGAWYFLTICPLRALSRIHHW
jgi:hypothetical protein